MRAPNQCAKHSLKWLWRKLPRSLREKVFVDIFSSFAPVPKDIIPQGRPVVVVGYLSAASGIGAAARACYEALSSAGIDVYAIDLTERLGGQRSVPINSFRDGKALTEPATLILHVPGLHLPRALLLLGTSFLTNKRRVAHWFWELSAAPDIWRTPAKLVDEIWVNTKFVSDAVAHIAPDTPVKIAPYPLTRLAPQETERHRPNDTRFHVLSILNIASNFARKNPCAAIKAFRCAFGDDPSATLTIKVSNLEAWPAASDVIQREIAGASNIRLLGGLATTSEISQLYQSADVVISLHRAEGLGLVVAEAMQRGIPVIATNWSGNCDFFDDSVGIPVNYRLININDPQNFYHTDLVWADPIIEDAKTALQRLRDDAQLRSELAKNARARAEDFFAPRRYVDFVIKHLGKPHF